MTVLDCAQLGGSLGRVRVRFRFRVSVSCHV